MVPLDRTVADYETASDVTKALERGRASVVMDDDGVVVDDNDDDDDWRLKDYNVATTVKDPNNIPKETARLMCLKSYRILDTEPEIEFEEVTQLAQKIFQCPIAVVSLVDMGRQWFKSIQGLPGVKSTPRCMAFCAHVIQQKNRMQVMVVPDATQDARFQNNPLVTGGPKIRFYAGAALITPEGQKVGTLCIIDTKPHPDGLNDQEKFMLQNLAQEVVLQMIMRVSSSSSR
jgi:GAF domain-containing protein